MYNSITINDFVDFVQDNHGIADKEALISLVQQRYGLIKERKVFYRRDFAVRFCTALGRNFGNTVLSLSALQKYDMIPFMVCLVTPHKNYLMLANTTFLRKISHSSQDLRMDHIRGSFNGGDIMRDFNGVSNEPCNFESLFTLHENFSFEENLERLVQSTNMIQPTGRRFLPTDVEAGCIRESVDRAISFLASKEYKMLNHDLRERVNRVSSEIAIASFNGNVNLRGRMIEYLITSADDSREALVDALHAGRPLPEIYTADKLGDYEREFDNYSTAIDIKTKALFLSSNPKGYNIDKMLSFLATDHSVYLIYIVAIDSNKNISTRLCSMYNRQILQGTRIIKHWAGRNSRGVTQYDGSSLEQALLRYDSRIDYEAAAAFIETCLNE